MGDETYHDEVEIEDFEYDEETEIYTYPCPCGDKFEISLQDLQSGEDVATCPSCSLLLKVIYDPDDFLLEETGANMAIAKVAQKAWCCNLIITSHTIRECRLGWVGADQLLTKYAYKDAICLSDAMIDLAHAVSIHAWLRTKIYLWTTKICSLQLTQQQVQL